PIHAGAKGMNADHVLPGEPEGVGGPGGGDGAEYLGGCPPLALNRNTPGPVRGFSYTTRRSLMHTIIHGDCLEELKKIEDNSVDAVITDPPYGLSNTKPQQVADVLAAWVTGDTVSVPAKRGGFMGKDWDSFVPPPAVWEECMRVLKPGGHMAVFAGARTQDLM